MKHFKIIYKGITYEFDAEEVEGDGMRQRENPMAEAVLAASLEQPAANAKGKPVMAPIAGRVLEIPVTVGSTFAEGDTLILLDAMKMEISVQAEEDGTVESIKVKKGCQVDMEQIMITYR